VKLSEKRNFDLESDKIADSQVILQGKAKDQVGFAEIKIMLDPTGGRVDYQLHKLSKAGLVEKNNINCAFRIWTKKAKKMLWTLTHVLALYASGVITTFLFLKWEYLNNLCMKNPLIFWLLGILLSIIGIYISLSKDTKKTKIYTTS